MPAHIARTASCMLVLCLAGSSWSCDEALPPREDPSGALTSSLDIASGVFEFRPIAVVPPDTIYSINYLDVSLKIENHYVEVFQDSFKVTGGVEIWDAQYPERRALVSMSRPAKIIPSEAVARGILTLPPNSHVRFTTPWLHYLTDTLTHRNEPAWVHAAMTERLDPAGETYFESVPVQLLAAVSLRLFRKTPPLKTDPIDFFIVYHVYPVHR